MLVRPKLLILTTLFDDPSLKIPREISMDGISVSNSIQQYPNIFYLNWYRKKNREELKSFESYMKITKKIYIWYILFHRESRRIPNFRFEASLFPKEK